MANDGSVVIGIDGDSSGFKKELSGIGGVAKSALSGMGSIAKTAMAGVGTAIGAVTTAVGAIGTASAKVGMDFESSMSQVAATMGMTTEQLAAGSAEFDLLKQAAKDAGASTAFSATEAAEALNYLALAGYDAETAADALPAVLNLAAAGGLDLAYASDLATDAMSALGIEASKENLTKFGDQMARTASKANTSVGQLGEAILTVGGTAKSLAGGTTELNAALGVLANRGIKGSEGGTALRNVILSLSAPTDKAAGAMEALGLEVYDAAGNMRPLNQVFKDLGASLEGMSEGEKTQVLNEIFNKVDLKSAQALLAGCGEEFDNLAESIENSAGAMQAMADTQLDNLEGDITILKSGLEGLGISIYENMNAPLRETAQYATEMVGKLATAINEGGLTGLVEVAGGILADVLVRIAQALPQFIQMGTQVLQSLISGLLQNKDSLAGSAVEIGVSLLSGIGSITGDIILAGLDIIVALADSIAQQAPKLIPAAAEAIAQFAQGLNLRVGNLLASGLELIGALVQGIAAALPVLVESVPQIIAALMAGITAHAPDILYAGHTILTSLSQGLTENLALLAEFVPQLIESIATGITTYLPNLLMVAQQIITGLVQGITEALPVLLEVGLAIVNSLVSTITENLPVLAEAALNILQTLIQGIVDNLPALLDAALNIIQSLCQGIVENLPTLVETALQMVMSLVQGILDSLPSLVDAAVQLVATLVETIWNTDWVKIGSDILQFIVDGIAAILGSLLDIAFQLVNTLIDTIGEVNWFQVGADVLNFIINGIASLLGSLLSLAVQLVSTVWDKIATTDWVSLGRKVLDFIINGIRNLIPNLLSAAQSVVKTVWDKVTSTNWLQLGSDLLKKFISGIRNVLSSLATLAKEIVSKIWDTITHTDWLGVGRNIISGIANGIGNAAGMLIQAARNVAANALNAIKSFFGIASPSKVMAKEVGRWLPPGIGKGMEQAMPQLDQDMKDQLQDLVDGANIAVAAEVGGVSSQLNASTGSGDHNEAITNDNGIIVNVNVNYTGPGDPEDAREIGQEMGAKVAREIRRRGLVPT